MSERIITIMKHLQQLAKEAGQSPEQKFQKHTEDFTKWEKMLEEDATRLNKWLEDFGNKIESKKK
ncbi:hypothetical protein [Alkalibacillus aidingensis]|uniref:hypothetical protein n=1 Tax=Alkalibacillus aidingensis TaxID=2747607 RepID=UPI001660DCF6|nr:hypothetical protein [Alkalibacillus aidingensis]